MSQHPSCGGTHQEGLRSSKKEINGQNILYWSDDANILVYFDAGTMCQTCSLFSTNYAQLMYRIHCGVGLLHLVCLTLLIMNCTLEAPDTLQ